MIKNKRHLMILGILLGFTSCMISSDFTTPTPPKITPLTATKAVSSLKTPTIALRITSTATPPSLSTPTLSTEQSLAQTDLPLRDLDDLARRFKGSPETLVPPRNNFQLGAIEQFWVLNNNSTPPTQFQISTELRYMTDHAYWWVEPGFRVDQKKLIASAERFETQTYPTTRDLFGSEWSPGIDADERVHIVMGNVPGVAGYFAASNEYSSWANEYSNQHEMFLINLKSLQPGSHHFNGVLAHEFQHMIHWHQDRNEESWVNEGLSELATAINGFGSSNFVNHYTRDPDLQLNTWAPPQAGAVAHYGYSYLFAAYFYERFGAEAVRALVALSENGIAGVEKLLATLSLNLTFDDIFADFMIANFLNDPTLTDGRWGYTSSHGLSTPRLQATHARFPIKVTETVHQYGVDYIEIKANGDSPDENDLIFDFKGETKTRLIPPKAYSGHYVWYSHRGDGSDVTLTRAFDLTELDQATLRFQTWYDIEEDWDYAYVAVSTDEGLTWETLPASSTTTHNPVGYSYGYAFTGKSGHPPSWQTEHVDLSAYAGQKILLRFEMITDDAVNQPGFVIDDIAIPQLGYFDDVEASPERWDAGWNARGFIRTDNQLPQYFIVQIIEFPIQGTPLVKRVILDEQNAGQYHLLGLGETLQRVVVVISAQAAVTTEVAKYEYRIRPKDVSSE